MDEKDLLYQFKKILVNNYRIEETNIFISENNKSTNMDFNIVNRLTNTCICLEAKTFNDMRSNSNNYLSLFGKILKGRKIREKSKDISNMDYYEYGFLFHHNNINRIKTYFGIINRDDWIIFCKTYDLKYIYIVNENGFDLFKAIDFIDNIKVDCVETYLEDSSIVENDTDDR
ncbi:MAG: hypothetical protein PHF05_05810 [Candidatus Izemoplasmatales bacterium]|nr:hypothetical protein [Candidatus Izemoplasmatales bacterium]